MKKCVRYITAWLLTVVMVAVTVFQWGGLAADPGGSVKAAGLVDLSDEDTNDVRIEWKNGDGEFRYTGAPLEPEITLKVNGRTVSSDNYTVEYKDNTGLRTGSESAKVTVYGIESRGYTGSCYAYFHIKEGDLSKATVNFDGGAYYNSSMLNVPYVKPGIIQPKISSVMYGDTKLYENKDYIISVPEKYEFAEPQPVNTTASFSVKGKDNSNWSTTSQKTVTWQVVKTDITKENTVNIVLEYANCMYDGTEKRPAVTVEDPRVKLYYAKAEVAISTTLTKDEDYTVTYENNTNAGTAKVVITGMGGYTGSVTKEFTITDSTTVQDIAQADITAADVFYTGKSVETEVKVVYNGKTLVKDQDYTVSYKDNISVGDKTATAVISGKGDYVGTKEVKFSINKKNLSDATIQVTAPDVTYVYGSAIPRPTVTVKDTASDVVLTNGTDYRIDYTGDYPETVGQYAFTITAKEVNYTGSTSGTYRIQPLDASKLAEVSLAQTEYEYTGEAFMPAVTKVSVGTASLEENKDYTVSYEDNVDAGDKAQVIVTFKGNYTGSKIAYFTITSPLPNLKDAELTVSDQTYTGKQIAPAVGTVTIGGRTFTEGKDYTVSYGENKNAGYGQITLTAVKGNEASCAGTKLIEFKINPANINQSCTVKDLKDGQSFAYTGSVIRPKFTVLFGDRELTADEDYAVQYGNDNPVDAGSYLIVITGKGNFTDSINMLYTIAAVSIDGASVRYGTYADTYDGTEKTPEVTALVLKDGTVITDMSRFDVTYADHVNAGTATITVAPKSTTKNYTGTASTTFVIKKAALSADTCTISDISDQTFTESEIKPEPTVKAGGRTLVKGTDYTISYTDNTNVGTATIHLTGTGNYTGSVTKEFQIISRSINDAKVTVPDQIFTGTALAPNADQVSVVLDGKKLDSKYYTVKYTDNTDAGTAAAIVTGRNGYSDSTSGTFTIGKAAIADCTPSYAAKVMWNNGQAVTPEITLTFGSYPLVKGTDYTVSYENNQDETTSAEIHVTGTGNFTGNATYYFEITRNRTDINDSSISVKASDLEYDGGKEVKPVITVAQNGKLLAEGESYDADVTNKSNGYEVGSVITVKITGKDAFAGTREVTFKITAIDLTDASVELEQDVYEYTGAAIVPAVKKVTTKSGKSITDLSELNVQPSNSTNAGTNAALLITGQTSSYTGSVTKTFEIRARSIKADDVICEVNSVSYTGSQLQPAVKVNRDGKVLQQGTDKDYRVVSYGENINAGIKAGSVVIEGMNNYTGQRIVYFDITPQDIEKASVNVNGSYTYNGTAWEPQASELTVTINNKTLTAGEDYQITGYDKNTDAGTATVTVSGSGNYTGTVIGKFTIAAKNLQDSSINVSCASKVSYEDGRECKPSVSVFDGSRELTEGEDYTVTYQNNTAETTENSKAQAVVEGMGNYTGQIIKEFEISKDIINITGAVLTVNKIFAYNGSEQKPVQGDITVTLTDGTRLSSDFYNIKSVTDNKNAGKAKVIIEGCNGYSGTVVGYFDIAPKNIAGCQVHHSDYVDYTGAACEPGVTVMDGESVELTKGKDYEVSYSDNVEPGKATLTVTGKGNYTGTHIGNFTIVKKESPEPENPVPDIPASEKVDLSSAVITVADQTYTGAALTPSVTVVLNGAVLPESAYTVSYSNNVNVGTAAVTITGTGNYTGSVSKTFVIKAAEQPATPAVNKPGKVKGISVKSVKTTSATLKWKKVSGASGYMIYQKNPSTGKTKLVKTVNAKTTSYKATKLKAATNYTYTIYAYKLSGKTKIKGSGASYTFVTKPGAVKKMKAASKKTKTCVISWKKTKGADGYEVYMSASKKGKYKKIGQTKKISLTKKKLKKGKTCYFKVRAYKTYKGKKTYGAYTKAVKVKIR